MFISFEGGDGAGKTTQVEMLAQYLRSHGYDVVTTREPGGTPVGQEIRRLLLHGADVSDRAEALLYAADRAHHVDTVIRPALERGEVVITDRFVDSSVAYQGVARALGTDEVKELSMWATNGLMPDLTILLDIPVESATLRRGTEPDRIEAAGAAFHEAVREEFLGLARLEPHRWVVIDGTASIAEISAQIHEVMCTRMGIPASSS